MFFLADFPSWIRVGFWLPNSLFMAQIFSKYRKAEQCSAFLVQLRSKINHSFWYQNLINDVNNAVVSCYVRCLNHTLANFDAHSSRIDFEHTTLNRLFLERFSGNISGHDLLSDHLTGQYFFELCFIFWLERVVELSSRQFLKCVVCWCENGKRPFALKCCY